jgi:hypothetical protein
MPRSASFLLGTTLVLSLALAAVAMAQAPATTAAPAPAIEKAPGFPANYKGTPYKGVAQVIPGRVELENFDEGGLNVAFNTQHHEGDSSGKDYRAGAKPQICVTNGAPSEQDKFVDGKRYPSEGTANSYYIGYARPNDWVICTVNVKKAGVYRVNTTAANETKKMTFSLSFNDVKKADVKADGTGSYHIWKLHENICTVKLDAGLQVMKFQLGSEPHMNYDYLEFVYDEKASDVPPVTPATSPR